MIQISTVAKMLIFQVVLLSSANIFAENLFLQPPNVTSFVCPPNITLQCWQDYNNTAVTGHPSTWNPGTWYFSYEDEVNLSPCREGSIVRTWTGISPLGQWTCEQTITMVYNVYFNGQIQWPADWTGTCVEEIPFNEPRYDPGFCDMIAHNYKDDTINLQGNVCYKILRNWKVIDCCRYQPNSGSNQGIWLHTQVLTVVKQEKPVFNECKTIEVGAMNSDCTASFQLTKSASDIQCEKASKLKWKVLVDYFSCDGIDTTMTGEGNEMIVDFKNVATGTHKIYWEVYDHCGNVSQCEENFIVSDKKAPTPFCYLGVHTVLMPSSGMLEVHAKEYIKDAFDNCSTKKALRYSWRINPKDSVKLFSCSDLGFQFLPIYVFDEAGNKDFCFIFTRVEMHGECNPGQNLVSGSFVDLNGKPVNNVIVKMGLNIDNSHRVATSDAEGKIQFPYVETIAQPSLFMERMTGTNAGYSTLDLVLLWRYLLGLYMPQNEDLFKWAADINQDGKVNTLDLTLMRKVLLGQIVDFPGSSTPVKVIIPDPENPGKWLEKTSLDDFKNGFEARILNVGNLRPFLQD